MIAAAGTLEPVLADSLRNAWGGGAVQWLAPDEAAEFPVAVRPDNFWDIWADLQGRSVDLICQSAENRRKSILIADMDSTMIGQECIDELADVAGIGDRVAAITARAMNGELGYEASFRERVGLLAGLPDTAIDQVWRERITLTTGGNILLATMRAHGGYTALVSGGFTAFTARVAKTLGFDEHRANELPTKDGKITGAVVDPILGRDAKVTALAEICARCNRHAADVIAVGDGANDLGMLAKAGAGVALHAKPSVAKQVDIRINHSDLTALLYLQGYAKTEFITPETPLRL